MSNSDWEPLTYPEEPWHGVGIDQTLVLLRTSAAGLTSDMVAVRQAQYGPNAIQGGQGRGRWQIFLDQFRNVMLVMLIAVAVVSGVMDWVRLQAGQNTAGSMPFKDTIAILAIVGINGILGYVQESRAEKALAALKRLAAPKVQVLRDGDRQEVAAASLVPGDIMLLEAGTQLCADGQLLEASQLTLCEAALTGEAQSVIKRVSATGLDPTTPLGDRHNMVFAGTEVTQGRGRAVVTQTGMATELGNIAQLLSQVENEPTPLQQRMDNLGNVLVSGSLLLVALVITVGVVQRGWGAFQSLVEVSLSMAVAVVPEGLPAVITVTLALGTQRMVKRHALIRKLPAVETLGSVNVICSDKTGTLTQNKMVAQTLLTYRHRFSVTGTGYNPQGQILPSSSDPSLTDPALPLLLLTGLVCNDAHLTQGDGEWQVMGDPTEGSLLVLAHKGMGDGGSLGAMFPRLREFPFTSDRKRMSVVVPIPPTLPPSLAALTEPLATTEFPPDPYLLLCKGAPEGLLVHCQSVLLAGECVPLALHHRQQILQDNNDLAAKGLRVLGFAYRRLGEVPPATAQVDSETDLIWLGMVGLGDAPRPEVKEAVAKCLAAGIRTVMITGDHHLTAMAIAQELGISRGGDQGITGPQLEQMTQPELEAQVEQISVFARVSPEHKLRIVQALQRRHKFVAMTGDGVNDAPALKQADIGIAMGITGTDVCKEASDMVLLDDNFATIVAATEEGRVVYTNIRRFIKYILGSNIGEVITIAAAPLLGLPGAPLTPLQILWMNLVTDGLPALALALEPGDRHIMDRRPFSPKESIFARGLGAYMVRIGLIFAAITISLMLWSYNTTQTSGQPDSWKTMVFTTLCIAQMGHAIAVRSNERLTLEMNPLTNPYLWGAVLVTTGLQLLLIYVEPLRQFFGTDWLSPQQLAICLGFSSLMFVWVEGEKLAKRAFRSLSPNPVHTPR